MYEKLSSRLAISLSVEVEFEPVEVELPELAESSSYNPRPPSSQILFGLANSSIPAKANE